MQQSALHFMISNPKQLIGCKFKVKDMHSKEKITFIVHDVSMLTDDSFSFVWTDCRDSTKRKITTDQHQTLTMFFDQYDYIFHLSIYDQLAQDLNRK